MRTKHVLNNACTSKTFYAIVNGISKTKNIADSLRVTSPTITEQINRLTEETLVKYGERDKQYRPYKVDIEGLSNKILDECTWRLHDALTKPGIYPNDEMIKKQLGQVRYWELLTGGKRIRREKMFSLFKSQLKNNPFWKKYIHSYIKFYANPAMQSLEFQPLFAIINEFENSLRVEMAKIDPKVWEKLQGPIKENFQLLHIWALLIQETKPLTESSHEAAILELAPPEIVEKIYKSRRG